MTEPQGRVPSSDVFRDVTVVDADVHGTYKSDAVQEKVASRMDEPYGSILLEDGVPKGGWPRTMGGRLTEHHSAEDPETGIAEALCERNGIDHPIVNVLTPIDKVRGDERALQEMRAANDVLLEHFLDERDEFFGLCNVAMRKPEAAAAEIDRLGGEDQIVGALMLPGWEYQKKPLGDPVYDVVYEALDDNDLTPVFHATHSGLKERHFPVINDFQTFLSGHAVAFSWGLMMTLTSLVVQGVPEKFPGLDFVMHEAGVGWIGYMMGRLNDQCAWRSMDAPLLEKTPEEYIRDQFYFGMQPLEEFNDPADLRRSLEIVGADSLMFTSDWPHWDFDTPESVDRTLRAAFSPEERERILAGNAVDAFDLPA